MNSEDQNQLARAKGIYEREKKDPEEGFKPWPSMLGVILLSLTVWAVSYLLFESGSGESDGGDSRTPIEDASLVAANSPLSSSEETRATPSAADGPQIYGTICQACHQANGEGLAGVFPPLAGSEWLVEDIDTPIRIVLFGLGGPIAVKEQTFNGVMPAFGGQLSDDEIAAVLTHVRSTFGNKTTLVSAADVKKLREQYRDKKDSWTAKTLRP